MAVVVRGRRKFYAYPRWGRCQCCGQYGELTAHHVVTEQTIRRYDRSRVYDLDNRLLVGWYCCHYRHHNPGVKDTRIDFDRVPERARRFAVELMGEDRASSYFARRYRVNQEENHAG